MTRLVSLSCLTAVVVAVITLCLSGWTSDLTHKADTEAGLRRYQDRLLSTFKAKGYIDRAWADGATLVVVPGPEWSATDEPTRKTYLRNIAEIVCGDRNAPVEIREKRSS